MGKSTQKVDKGERPAPVAASNQQPAAYKKKLYRVSDVTFGTFSFL